MQIYARLRIFPLAAGAHVVLLQSPRTSLCSDRRDTEKPITTGLCWWDDCNKKSFTMWSLFCFVFFFLNCGIWWKAPASWLQLALCVFIINRFAFCHLYYSLWFNPVCFWGLLCGVFCLFFHHIGLRSVWPSFEKTHL